MTAATRREEQSDHPLRNREIRTALNWSLQEKADPAKVCSQCLTIKALKAFNRFKSSSDGIRSHCRDCQATAHARRMANDTVYVAKRREAGLAYYHANSTARKNYAVRRLQAQHQANLVKNANKVPDPNVLKQCGGKCRRTLPETSFRLDRGKPDGLRLKCRDCADSSKTSRRACTAAYGKPVGRTCYLCMNIIASPAIAQADHLLPTCAGGPDEASNLWWTHEFCNRSRGARPLTSEEWDRVHALQREAVAIPDSNSKEMTS